MRAQALIAVVCGVSVSVAASALGQWQTRRGDAKSELQRRWDAALAAPPLQLTLRNVDELAARAPVRVRVSGAFEPERLVWLDNRQYEGRAGMRAVMAMRLDDGTRVPVDRGWAPRDLQDRARLPELKTPSGVVTIEGLALQRAPRLLELGAAATAEPLPALWQNLDYDRFSRATKVPIARVLVQQISAADDGLVRDVPKLDAGVERHRGYAFQWYALALLSAGLTAFYGWRSRRTLGKAG